MAHETRQERASIAAQRRSAGTHLGTKGSGRFEGRRAKKPKLLAVVTDACTGCAGAPVCQVCCPVDRCLVTTPAQDAFPFQRIWADPLKCVGCRKCVTQGSLGTLLDGCPWDAIVMVPTDQWEMKNGTLPY